MSPSPLENLGCYPLQLCFSVSSPGSHCITHHLHSHTYLGRHHGHTSSVTCLALDGAMLFSGSEDTTVRLWDAVPTRLVEPTSDYGGAISGATGERGNGDNECNYNRNTVWESTEC